MLERERLRRDVVESKNTEGSTAAEDRFGLDFTLLYDFT